MARKPIRHTPSPSHDSFATLRQQRQLRSLKGPPAHPSCTRRVERFCLVFGANFCYHSSCAPVLLLYGPTSTSQTRRALSLPLLGMAASASYHYTHDDADDSLLSADPDFLTTQSFKSNYAYPTTSSAFDKMTTPGSLMPTSSDANSMPMSAFAEFAGNSTAWGQHAMDFSGVFNGNGPPSWSWPAEFSQPGQYNVRNGLDTPLKNHSSADQSFRTAADSIDPSEVVNTKKRARKTSKAGSGSEKSIGGSKLRKNSKTKPEFDEMEEDEGEDGDKREKFLERNRVAASKCRQKKKVWTNSLEERARELTSQRQMLAAHVAMLRNELLELKCKCLEHTSCECEQIREYLKNTVAALQPAAAALYQFQQNGNRRESIESEAALTDDKIITKSPYASSNAASRQSSTCSDSPLNFLKIEDEVRTTLTQSLDTKRGDNEYRN
jgi:hypothetical protein